MVSLSHFLTSSLCSSGCRTSLQHFLLYSSAASSPQWVGCLSLILDYLDFLQLVAMAQSLPTAEWQFCQQLLANLLICTPETFAQDCIGNRLLAICPIVKYSLFRHPTLRRALVSPAEHRRQHNQLAGASSCEARGDEQLEGGADC